MKYEYTTVRRDNYIKKNVKQSENYNTILICHRILRLILSLNSNLLILRIFYSFFFR